MCSKVEILAAVIAALFTTMFISITIVMMKSAYDHKCNLVKEPRSLDLIAEQLLKSIGIEPQDPTAKVDRENVKRFFFNNFPTFVDPDRQIAPGGNKEILSNPEEGEDENINLHFSK